MIGEKSSLARTSVAYELIFGWLVSGALTLVNVSQICLVHFCESWLKCVRSNSLSSSSGVEGTDTSAWTATRERIIRESTERNGE